jgi:hypothetical protein
VVIDVYRGASWPTWYVPLLMLSLSYPTFARTISSDADKFFIRDVV